MRGDDLVPLLAAGRGRGAVLSVHTGVLTAWTGPGANTVTVAGADLEDLPALDTGVALAEGDVVLLLRNRSSWLILGRVAS